MERLRKKADVINESTDLSEREKAKSITNLLRKTEKKVQASFEPPPRALPGERLLTHARRHASWSESRATEGQGRRDRGQGWQQGLAWPAGRRQGPLQGAPSVRATALGSSRGWAKHALPVSATRVCAPRRWSMRACARTCAPPRTRRRPRAAASPRARRRTSRPRRRCAAVYKKLAASLLQASCLFAPHRKSAFNCTEGG